MVVVVVVVFACVTVSAIVVIIVVFAVLVVVVICCCYYLLLLLLLLLPSLTSRRRSCKLLHWLNLHKQLQRRIHHNSVYISTEIEQSFERVSMDLDAIEVNFIIIIINTEVIIT